MATTGTQLERSAPAPGSMNPLQAGLAAVWARGRVQWASMQAAQRRWSMVAGALLLALLAGVLWYGLRTEWRTLYAGLDPEDARQTGETLTQAQIPFDVAANGTAILVPAPMLDKARLATAAKGGVRSGRLGFELFDRPNWVGSEFDERVNYQRALEGELEHTVATLSDVQSARVHLVLPHDSLFRDEERPAKATVVLKLRHASLADGEADSIRNLVASAVDGLNPDRVVLVDAAGRLSLGPKTPEGELLSAEQALEEKLISTLEPVTGAGNVRASVTLDYDESNSEETRETYDPDKSATLSMQRTEQSSGSQQVPAGVPGTASNAPNSQALPVYPKQVTPPETSKSESSTYGVSKDVRRVVETPGRVRRLTAAVVVNHHLLHAASSKGGATQWQPWSPDQLRNLTALAQAAVGFDGARGDVLTVEDLAFDENSAQTQPSLPSQFLGAAENSPVLVKYVALFAALLLVLAFGVRPALKLARIEQGRGDKAPDQKELPAPVDTQPVLGTLEPAATDPERLRAQQVFEQVTGHLKREPAQSSRLLQSWIHSD